MDTLPRGTFDLEEWKRFYSNNAEDPSSASFLEHFDHENHPIWRGDHKHNDELTMVFMSCNLIGGMFQRLEAKEKGFLYPVVCSARATNPPSVGSGSSRGRSWPLSWAKTGKWTMPAMTGRSWIPSLTVQGPGCSVLEVGGKGCQVQRLQPGQDLPVITRTSHLIIPSFNSLSTIDYLSTCREPIKFLWFESKHGSMIYCIYDVSMIMNTLSSHLIPLLMRGKLYFFEKIYCLWCDNERIVITFYVYERKPVALLSNTCM